MRFTQVAFTTATLVAAVSAGPMGGDHMPRAAFTLQNGKDAQALNAKFQGLSASSPCTTGEQACVKGQLGQCVGGKFALSSCAATLQCVALPLVNKAGTRYEREISYSLPRLSENGDTALRVIPRQTQRRASPPLVPQVVSSESVRSRLGTYHLSFSSLWCHELTPGSVRLRPLAPLLRLPRQHAQPRQKDPTPS